MEIKKHLPHLWVILAFIGLSFAYNSPLLTGKALKMDDMVQVAGMSKESKEYKAKEGQYPLWTNALFSGMPTYQIATENNYNWIGEVKYLFYNAFPVPANLMILYFLGFYFLLSVLGFRVWYALLGALAFGLSTYNLIIIDAGHITKAVAIGFMPMVLAALIKLYRGEWLVGFALTALMLAFEIGANHYQITYYLGMMIVLYVVVKAVEAVQEKQIPRFLKASGLAVAALLLAVGVNFTNFALTQEYSKYTMRGGSELKKFEDPDDAAAKGLDKDYALRWSNGVTETFTILIPNFFGGASVSDIGTSSSTYEVLAKGGVPRNQAAAFVKQAPTYFGDQPGTAGPTYFGALMVFLFVLALFVLSGPAKWWLGSAALLSIVLSWGRNFELVTDLFFNYVPFYSSFRAVAMSLVIASLAFPFLALILLRRIEEGRVTQEKLKKGLVYATSLVGGFCLLFVLAPGAFFDFASPADGNFGNFPGLVDALMEDRKAMLRNDAIKSLLLVLLGAGGLWYFLQNKLSMQRLLIIFLLANTADLWMTNKRYLNDDDFVNQRQVSQPFEPNAADLRILQDTTLYYRVFDLGNRNPFNENRASYFHKSVGGYHAAKLGRYEDLKSTWLEGQLNMNVLNMLNTRWFIVAQEGQGPMPQYNPDAFGNAWFVNRVVAVENVRQEIDTLGRVDLRNAAVVAPDFASYVAGKSFQADSSASIRLTQYHPDRLTYAYEASSEQLTVFSEVYYEKGWQAYLDGNPVPHFRVNYVLRAMVLPAGQHEVSFKFEPKTYAFAEQVSLASNAAVVLLALLALAMQFRKPKETAVQAD